MHAKRLEMASYEPRRSTGMGLGYATANRGGCHLNGGYVALMESVGVMAWIRRHQGKPGTDRILTKYNGSGFGGRFLPVFSADHCPGVPFHTGPASKINAIAGNMLASGHCGKMWAIIPWGYL